MASAITTIDYIKEAREGGIWHFFTGKTFSEWASDVAYNSAIFVYKNVDYSILFIMCFTLFAMCGSKKCVSYIYWTSIGYLIIKSLGSVLL